jgi:transketolase C-terminal domain/subunit
MTDDARNRPGLGSPGLESPVLESPVLEPPYRTVVKPYGHALVELARRRPEIVCLSGDLTRQCEIDLFQAAFPDRFIHAGMAEANMIGVAGALARSGLIPFVHTFGVFATRRPFDQIVNAVAYPHLPVRIIGFMPGVSSPGGPSHQAIEDVALMRALPGMTVIDVADATETAQVVAGIADLPGPVYLRLKRGEIPVIFPDDHRLSLDNAQVLVDGRHATGLARGTTGGGATAGGGVTRGGAETVGGAVTGGGGVTRGGAETVGGGVTRGGAETKGGAETAGGAVTVGGAVTGGGGVTRGGAETVGGGVTRGGAETKGGAETAGGAVTVGGAVTSGGGVTRGGAETVGRGGMGVWSASTGDARGQLRAPVAVPRSDVALLVSGMMVAPALAAARVLRSAGIATLVLNIPVIKPLDTATVLDVAAATRTVITAENHSTIGGLGSAVAETLAESALPRPLHRIGLTDTFAEGARTPTYLFRKYGLTTQHLINAAWAALDQPGTPPRSQPLPAEEGEYAPV